MASTWAATAGNEWVTRAAMYDLVENVGDAAWSGTAPSGWSTSGRWVTWADLHTYVELESGAPGEDTANGGDPSLDPYWDRWPARNDMVAWLSEPSTAPTVAPGTPVLTVESGGVLRATWTNTGSYQATVYFVCVTNATYNSQRSDIIAGQTTTTYAPGNFTTETFQARLEYFNVDGTGPSSGWSNQVQSDINM